MKKILIGLLALIMVLGLVGCSSSTPSEETNTAELTENTPQPTEEIKAAEKTYSLGETVETDVIKFTLDRAELAIALHDGTAGDWDYICMPKEFEQNDDNSCFVASIGHTLCSLQFTLCNKNRVDMSIDEKTIFSVEYNGTVYSDCECKTGFYPSTDAHDWSGVTSLTIDAGSTLMYRCGVDFPTDASDLTDSFNLIVNLPTSENNTESFIYSVTEEDLKALSAKELSIEEAIQYFGYDDGYDYFAKHMDDYHDLTNEELQNSLVGETFKCYFIGEMSHMDKTGTFRDDGQWVYEYKGNPYTIPYVINENILTIDAQSDPFSGSVRQINKSAYLMVNNGKPSGIIYK